MASGTMKVFNIKYKDVTIPSVTTTSGGYTRIDNYFPSGMNNFLFAMIIDMDSATSGDMAVNVSCNGTYIYAAASRTFTNLKIRYFYTD
jgi:hypothetical protein